MNLLLLAIFVASPSTAWSMEMDPVLTTKADERRPNQYNEVLVWYQNTPSQRNQWNSSAREAGQESRLNAPGTESASVDIFKDQIVYQEFEDNTRSDLYIRTGVTGTPSKVASTRHGWEWQVRISGKHLVFLRGIDGFFHGRYQHFNRLMVHNLETENEFRLASASGTGRLSVGDVSGRWVVWSAYNKSMGWQVFRYNLRTSKKQRLEFTRGTGNYGPTVAANGVVYFSNATTSPKSWPSFNDFCGEPRVIRRSRRGTYKTVHKFGTKLDAKVILEEGKKGEHLLIERFRCPSKPSGRWRMDIYSANPRK